MSPWRFVGRSRELSLLTAAAAGETGRGLVICGAPGVGKSRLLREGLASLDPKRYAVVIASANSATGGLPLGTFAHALPADQPARISPAGLLRWALNALREQAAGRSIILAVDDVHLVDPLSAALTHLVARMNSAVVLATLRDGEPVHDSVSALWRDELVDRVNLEPLSLDETAELLASVLGGPVDDRTAERLHRLSAGNALLLRELILAAHDFTQIYGLWHWTGQIELTPSLVEIIDARIGRLTDEVRTVLELVSFGEPLGLGLLTQATDPAAVEVAEERQLITCDRDGRRSNVRLTHPLYGEVVRRRCPVTRKRRLLARLAELVEGAGARRREDLLRVAVWRVESESAHDPQLLLAAGQQAFASFDVPLAVALATAARDVGGGFDAADLLATILMFADRPADALPVLDAVADQLDTEERRARWHAARGLALYWGLSQDSAADELARATEQLQGRRERTWLMAIEATMRLHHLECDRAASLAQQVLDEPMATPSARAVARAALAHRDALRGSAGRAAATVADIENDAATWRDQTPHLRLALELARGTGLVLAGDIRGVHAMAAAGFADLFDEGEFHLGSGYILIALGQVARLRGRVAEATRHLRRACIVLAANSVFAGLAHAERAHAAALAGDAKEAALAMAEADRLHQPTMAVLDAWLEHARCWVRAASGDLAGAAATAIDLAGQLRDDALYAHEAIALHDAVRLGQPAAVVDRLAKLGQNVEDELIRLLAAHARAAADRDGPALLAVAEDFAAVELDLYAAEAAADAVNRLRESRSPQASEAARLFAELMDRCERPRTPGLAIKRPFLSPREKEVARLAAEGVTSRDIADRLFLSTRTVENHLHSVYAKLGISGRGQLKQALRVLADDC